MLDIVQSRSIEELMKVADAAACSTGHRKVLIPIGEIIEKPAKVGESM